jgi:hypothetical protein
LFGSEKLFAGDEFRVPLWLGVVIRVVAFAIKAPVSSAAPPNGRQSTAQSNLKLQGDDSIHQRK